MVRVPLIDFKTRWVIIQALVFVTFPPDLPGTSARDDIVYSPVRKLGSARSASM